MNKIEYNKESFKNFELLDFKFEHKEEYKCGIYSITNKVNNKVYIGQTKDIIPRWRNHLKKLFKHTHTNKTLQLEFDEYGWDKFIFKSLQAVDKTKELIEHIEYQYIFKLKNEGVELYNYIKDKDIIAYKILNHLNSNNIKFNYNVDVSLNSKFNNIIDFLIYNDFGQYKKAIIIQANKPKLFISTQINYCNQNKITYMLITSDNGKFNYSEYNKQ